MRKLLFPEGKWYIGVIVLLVFSLSVLSWLKLAKHTADRVFHVEVVSKEEEDQEPRWSVIKEPYLSEVDSITGYLLLGEIFSDQVIGSNDKWLFYKSRTDADPIGDYEGTNKYTPEEMREITESALKVQDEMKNRGIRFAVVVAPNKENVYSEYMPETYKHAEMSGTDLLIEYMKENGVNIISPKADILNELEKRQLYYYYDTHWNQLGAYVGVRNTLLSWDLKMPKLSERSITSKELRLDYHDSGEEDLAMIVGLRPYLTDEPEYEVEGCIPMDWAAFTVEQNSGMMSFFHNDNAVNDASILLVGDSFRHSMVPSLREQFSDVYVVHRTYYSPDIIDKVDPDYLMDEYVERYSRDIADIESLLYSADQ